MLFSIITINLNNSKGLLNTLSSVSTQKFTDYEHIIIDGFSTDESVIILNSINNHNCTWISEKDSGIYDAMNKGISLASSNRLLFLNSGDLIVNNNKFNEFISLDCDYDLVYSNVLKVNKDGLVTESKFPDILSLDYMICYGLPHQATIINKSLFDKIGFYNEKYKIISDWVFFMEALFFYNASYKYIDVTAINFDSYGISNQTKYLTKIISEQIDYISMRFPKKLELYKNNSPYVKKYFRIMPRWKKYFFKFLFMKFNFIFSK
jgi:glycosyltransferase involved in cell wall biosynthesis